MPLDSVRSHSTHFEHNRLVFLFYFLGQFGDHLPRNISKAVGILNELASKGSSVGQQVVTNIG